MQNLELIIICAVCFFIVYLSMFVTYHVVESDLFDQKQLYVIFALIWFIPVLGPLVILSIIWQDIKCAKKSKVPLLGYMFLASVLSSSNEANGGESRGGSISTSGEDNDL
jgi:hypothetical protein